MAIDVAIENTECWYNWSVDASIAIVYDTECPCWDQAQKLKLCIVNRCTFDW